MRKPGLILRLLALTTVIVVTAETIHRCQRPKPPDTLKLPPGLTARMPIGTHVAAVEPATVGILRCRTKVGVRVDGAAASSGAGEDRRGRPGRLGSGIGPLLTDRAQRLVNQSGKGCGGCGALATRLIGLVGHLRHGPGRVRPPLCTTRDLCKMGSSLDMEVTP